MRYRAARHGFADDPAKQFAASFYSQSEDFAERAAEIGIADGRGIRETTLEVRPVGGHEVERVGPTETAVLALALLQDRVGNFRRAVERFSATGVEAAKVDDDRREWRFAAPFE